MSNFLTLTRLLIEKQEAMLTDNLKGFAETDYDSMVVDDFTPREWMGIWLDEVDGNKNGIGLFP